MHGGPVQINVGLREPLAATDPRAEDLLHHGPWAHELDFPLAEAVEIDLSKRTLIIAGDSAAEEDVPDGVPIFAEPSSNLAWADESIVGYRKLLVAGRAFLDSVEQLVVVGKPTLSREVQALVRELKVAKFAIPGRHRVFNPAGDLVQVANPEFIGEPSEGWLTELKALAETLNFEDAVSDHLSNQLLIERVYRASSEADAVVFGASNIIRAADTGHAPQVQIFANRGLAGIDGTIGFAKGVAMSGFFNRVRALIGDLTAIHDLGSLAQEVSTAQKLQLQIVVSNDGGGRIFEKLEVAHLLKRDDFDQLFVTAHEVDFGAIAKGYGLQHALVRNTAELDAALELEGLVLIECVTNRQEL
jgi:2-succinyl-5-enolpyruvyl-6-hydroxy-3-cyclohexene-1-carboxylate synthase